MKSNANPPVALPDGYAELQARLGRLGFISQGSVVERGKGIPGGPRYQWTRVEKGKTVTVALSAEQYQWMKQAIANWREAKAVLMQMQVLSRQAAFANLPNPPRRKRHSAKVLGTKYAPFRSVPFDSARPFRPCGGAGRRLPGHEDAGSTRMAFKAPLHSHGRRAAALNLSGKRSTFRPSRIVRTPPMTRRPGCRRFPRIHTTGTPALFGSG